MYPIVTIVTLSLEFYCFDSNTSFNELLYTLKKWNRHIINIIFHLNSSKEDIYLLYFTLEWSKEGKWDQGEALVHGL